MEWVAWLGYLDWKYLEYSINSANCPVSPVVHSISPLIEEILEKSSRNKNYQNYH